MVSASERQLAEFIAEFTPVNQRLIRAVRKSLKALVPAADELVYDNYNFLVIAYCPTARVSDSYFSLGADKNGVTLFFGYNGTRIKDPHQLLQGTAARNRFVRVESALALKARPLRELLQSAVALSPPVRGRKGSLIVRSVASRRRPRR